MDPHTMWEKKGHRPRANVPICFSQRTPNSALYLSTHFLFLFCKSKYEPNKQGHPSFSPAAKLVLVSEDKGTPLGHFVGLHWIINYIYLGEWPQFVFKLKSKRFIWCGGAHIHAMALVSYSGTFLSFFLPCWAVLSLDEEPLILVPKKQKEKTEEELSWFQFHT